MMSIGAFSIDITLPSMPDMVSGLEAPYASVQWTITIYMLTAGFGQLLWGPASDRFGRRAPLAAGLALFVAGCLIAVAAPSIAVLLAGRACQGFGAAAAIVASRAIIRDLFSGTELARNLALATAIFAFGPIVAPLAGGAIAAVAGWRSIFVVLALFGAGLLAALAFMAETVPQRAPDALKPATIARRTGRLFANRQSRHFLVLSVVAMSAMLLIVTSASRLYEAAFGVTGVTFALFFATHGTGIIAGQMANRQLIQAIGTVPAMLIGNGVLVLAAGSILAVTAAGLMNPYLLTAHLILFATSYLIVYSNAAAMVLDPHGDIAGFAAAFYGFMSQIGAAIVVSLVVLGTGDSLTAFAGALLAICLATLVGVVWWLARPMDAGITSRSS